MASLDSMSKDGYTYYEMYLSCPVCFGRGKNTPASHWQHHSCGGTIYVGDNAHYCCKKCKCDDHVHQWSYGCQYHSSSDYDFVKATPEELAAVISIGGMFVTTTGLPWLQRFLENLN